MLWNRNVAEICRWPGAGMKSGVRQSTVPDHLPCRCLPFR
ncbi:hypothetical protein Y88_0947 [Novosphingobium nitrogenifigens DSM 19370]|uniref:Uncharacterized protein n=1 Tax=Novosphingobium nitrogenifigens DSM 19370 TaxID=983920 RepID=F1Z8V4_9SPHN|nr:hypothetical protein Y88_0947 [Novosphingobium nitrogenifigens DSM 19370]